ncbi:MAG: hypothetical protein H7039_07355 [Bryobacteraceae bacterium]|nr:hypothetical protein [Bryobacteraceae bacterium]
MTYQFTGFRQVNSTRHFAFTCMDENRSSSSVTVEADVILARKYNILVQDLPLMCLRLLEGSGSLAAAALTLTEANMVAVNSAARLRLADKQRNRKVPSGARSGQAWRQNPLAL